MKTTLRIITVMILALMLIGCETWHGLGRDVRGLTRWGCGDCSTEQTTTPASVNDPAPQPAPQAEN